MIEKKCPAKKLRVSSCIRVPSRLKLELLVPAGLKNLVRNSILKDAKQKN